MTTADGKPDAVRVTILPNLTVMTMRIYKPPMGDRCPCWDGQPCGLSPNELAQARGADRILAGIAHPELDHLLNSDDPAEYETALTAAMEADAQAWADTAERGEG